MKFVAERKGDKLAPIPKGDPLWKELEQAWIIKLGFTKPRTIVAFLARYYKMRKDAGRTDSSDPRFWLAEEEAAILAYVKERTGNELTRVPMRDPAWGNLEISWAERGFRTPRSAIAMYNKHVKLRRVQGVRPELCINSRSKREFILDATAKGNKKVKITYTPPFPPTTKVKKSHAISKA